MSSETTKHFRYKCHELFVNLPVMITVKSFLTFIFYFYFVFSADFFIMENEDGKTRGHPYKIHKLHSRLDIRKYSFTQSILGINAMSCSLTYL